MPISRKQAEFLQSRARFTLFCAGVGAGKTKAGSMWATREMGAAPGLGFIGANSFQQLTRVTLKAFIDTIDELRLPYVFGRKPPASWGRSAFVKHDMICSVKVGGQLRQVICAQLGTFNFHRGIEIRWFWIDETRDTKKEAFDVLIGRLRGGARDAWRGGAITTTPKGFDWLYDSFATTKAGALTDRRVIHATSHDNPWLPEGYIESLLANYSPRLAAQEVGGKFVNLISGQAFAEFAREVHVVENGWTYHPDLPLIHTWDFNLNPLCSCILQVDPATGTVWCFDEIHVEGSALTREGAQEFLRRYGQHRGMVKVYGDASGRSGHTSSEITDFGIVEDLYREAFPGRLRLLANTSNPGHADSVQDVNSMLLNAKGRIRLKFTPAADFTIRDLEQVTFVPGTRTLDKSNLDLTHHSDALRYYISNEHPARRGVGGFTPKGT